MVRVLQLPFDQTAKMSYVRFFALTNMAFENFLTFLDELRPQLLVAPRLRHKVLNQTRE